MSRHFSLLVTPLSSQGKKEGFQKELEIEKHPFCLLIFLPPCTNLFILETCIMEKRMTQG